MPYWNTACRNSACRNNACRNTACRNSADPPCDRTYTLSLTLLLLPLHPFNGLFSRTTWQNRYQKGKTTLDLSMARDDGVWGWQQHQLDHMQTQFLQTKCSSWRPTNGVKALKATSCMHTNKYVSTLHIRCIVYSCQIQLSHSPV